MNIVQFSNLGRFGRFGNQLFQYAFARSYAELHGAVLEVPDWIGRWVFKELANDKYISEPLPITDVDTFEWGKTNIDLLGYFQHKEAINIIKKENVLKWFSFHDCIMSGVPQLELCAHLRRGDYLYHNEVFCVVSEKSYLDACDKFGLDRSQLVWVSEEHKAINVELAPVQKMIFDFILLMKSKVLLRSNSTFAWWAGELGSCQVYSPIIDGLIQEHDVEFVRGNHPKLIDPIRSLKGTPKPACDLELK